MTVVTPLVSDETDSYVPLYVRLREELRKLIDTKASGEVMPTITAIKKQFNVSQPTVERAIQDLRAEGLITSRRGSGIYVTKQAGLIHTGVVFDNDILDLEVGDFYRYLLKALQSLSGGTSIMLHHYIAELLENTEHDRYSAVLHALRNNRLDILIILGAYWQKPLRASIPVIGFGYLPHTTHRVHIDHKAAVRQGVEALVGQGCRRIAFFGSIVPPRVQSETQVFEQSLFSHGLTLRSDWIQQVGGWGASETIRNGAAALTAIWSGAGEKPDGLVCVDEYVARGVVEGAPDLGIILGRTLKVASHATKGAPLLAQAPVTRMEFDPKDVARAMISLIGEIKKGNPTAADIFVPPSGN